MLIKMQEKSNPQKLLAGMKISTTTMEISMGVYKKAKNRSALSLCHTTVGHISEEV
jgi:hypothetical protein